jgi:hypothetical protein
MVNNPNKKNRYNEVIDKANIAITNKSIPILPFRICISGCMGSGKSFLIKDLLTNSKYYLGVFHHIIICSETLRLDTLYKDIIKLLPEHDLYDEYKELIDGTIIAKINRNALQEEQTLLLLDDVANAGIFTKRSPLSKFILRSRHYYCSIMFAVQGINLLDRYLRLNVSHYILFKSNNPGERKVMTSQMPELTDYFQQSLKKFQYLYLDINNHDESMVYWRDFTEKLLD